MTPVQLPASIGWITATYNSSDLTLLTSIGGSRGSRSLMGSCTHMGTYMHACARTHTHWGLCVHSLKTVTCSHSFFFFLLLGCFLIFMCVNICLHICTTCVSGAQRYHKMVTEPLELERTTGNCEPPSECWELIPGPAQEQQVLFTTEPAL